MELHSFLEVLNENYFPSSLLFPLPFSSSFKDSWLLWAHLENPGDSPFQGQLISNHNSHNSNSPLSCNLTQSQVLKLGRGHLWGSIILPITPFNYRLCITEAIALNMAINSCAQVLKHGIFWIDTILNSILCCLHTFVCCLLWDAILLNPYISKFNLSFKTLLTWYTCGHFPTLSGRKMKNKPCLEYFYL